MGQPFRLLVTGSRTWHDIAAIEQALTVILDRHPEGVLLVHGACPAEPTPSPPPSPPGPGLPGRGAPYRLAPVRASCRVPPQRRDDRPGRGWVRRVHPWRQPGQHQCRPAGQRSGHPRLAPHPALIDPGPGAGYVRDDLA
jgi:YspA, cpYpsA-related SLOG family